MSTSTTPLPTAVIYNAINAYQRTTGRTWGELARMLSVGVGELTELLSQCQQGKEIPDNSVIRAWVTRELFNGTMNVVDTPALRRIKDTVFRAYETRKMYAVEGRSGSGKTFAIAKYLKPQLEWLHYVDGSMDMTNKNFLGAVLETYSPNRQGARTAYEVRKQIEQVIRERASLLVIDEADQLDVRTLEALRKLVDAQGSLMGVVLLGEEGLESRLMRKDPRTGVTLKRFHSRVEEFVQLQELVQEDVIHFFREQNIGQITKSALDFLTARQKVSGGYRYLARIVNKIMNLPDTVKDTGEERYMKDGRIRVSKDELIDIVTRTH